MLAAGGRPQTITTTVIENNHCISDASGGTSPLYSITSGITITTLTVQNNTSMRTAAATAHGYRNSETYMFSPTSSISPTASGGRGINLTSLCSSPITSLCSDTTYGGARRANPRPGSGDWNTGAYQYSSGTTPTVATPTLSPSTGKYNSETPVTISTSTGGATLCYTTDGSTPTGSGGTCTHGSIPSSAVRVSQNETIEVVGTESGYNSSDVASATYQVGPIYLLQRTQSDTCAARTSTCTVTITATTAGTALVCFANSLDLSGQSHISSCTDSGAMPDTFKSCTALGGNSCNGQGTQVYSVDIQIVLNGHGGNTSLTCKLANVNSFSWTCGIYEFQSVLGTPPNFALDASGSRAGTNAQTTQSGVALTLSGTEEAIVQLGDFSTGPFSISPLGNGGNGGYILNIDGHDNGEAALWNTSSGSAPTWMLKSAGTIGTAAVALETPGTSQASNATFSPVRGADPAP